MAKKILITAAVHPWLLQTLTARGYEPVYEPTIGYQQLLQSIQDATGLIITTRIKVDKALIDAAPKLEWIGRLGSGMELVDVAYAEARNICCASSPEGNRNAVAEHSLGMLLSLMNKLRTVHAEVAVHEWRRNENRGTELKGKTVGIIGFGNTGQALATLLSGFGVTLLFCDVKTIDHGFAFARQTSLQEIQENAEIISLNLPLNASTRMLAHETFFANCKQKPWFVTACRGEVTSTKAVQYALENNFIRGAALDVLENEKPETFTAPYMQQIEWLASQPNVLLSPHIAGYSHESYLRMAEVLVQKLAL